MKKILVLITIFIIFTNSKIINEPFLNFNDTLKIDSTEIYKTLNIANTDSLRYKKDLRESILEFENNDTTMLPKWLH